MNLYEINAQLEEAFERAVDPETGEVNEEMLGLFNNLEMTKAEKEENVALRIKNLKADLEAYRNEKKRFDQKIKSATNQIEWLKKYLSDSLAGEKLKTARVSVYYTETDSVELKEGFTESDLEPKWLRLKVEMDKDGIKKALKAGEQIEGVQLAKNESIVIR